MSHSRKLYKNIYEILTLKGAEHKAGRASDLEDLSILKAGALLVEDGKVAWVGPESELPSTAKEADEVIDLEGLSVLPGFVEAHTHTIFAGDRSHEFEQRVQGATYQQIAKAGGGIQSTVKATRAAKEAELLPLAQKRVDRFARQGVTTLEVKSGYGLTIADELKLLNVANRLSGPKIIPTYLGPHALPFDREDFGEYLDEIIEDHLPIIKAKNLARRGDIFIEKGYFDLKMGKRYMSALKSMGFDFAVHADQLNPMGATELAVKMGAKSVDHAIEISDQEIELIANSQTTAVLLPAADFYINTPYPRARDLINAGSRVALATDFNPGTAPTQELSFVGLLARKEMRMTLPEVICAYTLGAAYALGEEENVGSLSEGKSADFITVDGSYESLFYQIGHHPVVNVWKNGEKLNFS